MPLLSPLLQLVWVRHCARSELRGGEKQGSRPVKCSSKHVMRAAMECYWPELGVFITVAFKRGRDSGPDIV
jgi:hypothetical protein